MRTIKFRGKRIDNGEWVYGYLLVDEDRYYICLQVNDYIKRDDYEVYMVEVDPETVGQYTELKDKNGKEIYEGDIVQDAWKINMVVRYINTSFYLCRKNVNGEYSKISNWRNLQTKEVIGNIHDNPELLEV